jgi:hypothetical protein
VLDSWDDDQLLAALGGAIRARQAVPDALVVMAKGAYAWHHIDAELAQLTYDSMTDLTAAMRSEAASIRALTLTSAHLSMELEVSEDCLLGQVIPPRAGTLEAQTGRGPDTGQPVPVAFPGRRRHRCADRMDHAVSIGASASAEADEGPAGGQGHRVGLGRTAGVAQGLGQAGAAAQLPVQRDHERHHRDVVHRYHARHDPGGA